VINIYQTNLGLNLSHGHVQKEDGLISHYTLSCTNREQLTFPLVERFAKIIQQLDRHRKMYRISEENGRIFHIVFND
jgi:hypothetical protein